VTRETINASTSIIAKAGSLRFVAATLRTRACSRFGPRVTPCPCGIRSNRACGFSGPLMYVGFDRGCRFLCGRFGSLGDETLSPDPFRVSARRVSSDLVSLRGNALDPGRCLEPLGVFERFVLSVRQLSD
jgi:hypothetical protein